MSENRVVAKPCIEIAPRGYGPFCLICGVPATLYGDGEFFCDEHGWLEDPGD